MTRLGLKPTDEEIDEVFNTIDRDNSGLIDREEFQAVLRNQYKTKLGEDELRATFKVFDQRNSMRIGEKELKDLSIKLGYFLSADEIKEMISVADINGDGYVDFEEFVRVMIQE